MMRNAFTGLAFVLFHRNRSVWICAGLVALSFVAERFLRIQGLFARSGSILTIAGLLLSVKHSLHFHLKLPKQNIFNILAGAGVFGSDMTLEDEKWVDDILVDEMYAVALIVIGTLLWAYGGYIMPSRPCT